MKTKLFLMSPIQLLFFLALLCSVAPFAHAQTSKVLVQDEPLHEEFSERTVQAPFSQLTPENIQLASPHIENLFYKSTAVQIRSTGSPTASIRGSAQAPRVLFLLDNTPLNFLDGFGGSALFVPTEILSHINIFEGPSSATYGNSAMGGSFHFIPRVTASPLLRLGSSSTQDNNAALLVPLVHTEKTQIQASAFVDADQGRYTYEDRQGDHLKRKNNSQKLQRYTLLGRQKRGDWRFSEFLLWSRLKRRTPGATMSPLVTDQVSEGLLAAGSSQYSFSPRLVWKSRLSYARLNSEFLDSYGPTETDSKRYWINQNITWQIAPGVLSQTTLELSHNEYTATHTNSSVYERNEPEVAQSFLIPLTQRLHIETIARYLQKYDRTQFQINAPYEIDRAKLWLTYSEGFRPPSLSDLYANTTYFIGNKDLQPETSKQWEMGARWGTEHLAVKSALFYTEYNNLLQSEYLPGGASRRVNIGEARTYGSSHTLTLHAQPWLWELSFSQLFTKDRLTGKPLKFSPQHQIFSALSYSWKKWTGTIQENYWGPFEDSNYLTAQDVTIKSWHSIDVLANVQLNKNLNFNFGVYNVFDKRRELTFGYPEPQRRFAGALEYVF